MVRSHFTLRLRARDYIKQLSQHPWYGLWMKVKGPLLTITRSQLLAHVRSDPKLGHTLNIAPFPWWFFFNKCTIKRWFLNPFPGAFTNPKYHMPLSHWLNPSEMYPYLSQTIESTEGHFTHETESP